MSKAPATAASSKPNMASKPRKDAGKVTPTAQREVSNAATPMPDKRQTELAQMMPRTKHALKDKLWVLYHNANCLTGVPMLNYTETVLLYLMLLGLIALTVVGAYKQLAKLGGAGVLATGADAVAGR